MMKAAYNLDEGDNIDFSFLEDGRLGQGVIMPMVMAY